MGQEFAVQTTRLAKEFDSKEVLCGVELSVKQGELYGILGANGAGKTTLLKLIAGLLEPSEGEVRVLGKSPWEEREQVLRQIGALIETPYFYEHLPAYENLSLHLAYMGVEADIGKALKRVGLANTKDKPVSKFSLGMRQRLGIARAILHRPKVILLDEPINGLDPVAIRDMRELFCSLREEGTAILLSSHILSEVEQTVERVAVLSCGRITEVAEMEKLKRSHPGKVEEYLIGLMNNGQFRAV